MKFKKAAFTLIELIISISILSIMMIFLYKSYSSLNVSNSNLKDETRRVEKFQKIKKVIYLDFLTALPNSTLTTNREKNEDAVFLQTTNSRHGRFNPYVAYMVKDAKLYRLESLKKITDYLLPSDSEFDIDYVGEVNGFRVYKSSDAKKEIYLVHVDFKTMDDVLLKIKVLNEE